MLILLLQEKALTEADKAFSYRFLKNVERRKY